MDKIFNFLKNNMPWIFDGIGVAVLTFLASFFIKEKIKERIKENKGKNNNIQKNIDGNNTGNQEMINCSNAQPILVQGDYINGIDKEQAQEIALEVFKSNSLELSRISSDIARKRAEELTNDFFDKIYSTNSANIEKLIEPNIQSIFISAQIQYAKSGEKVTKDMLIEALDKRFQVEEKSLQQKILDETILTINRITNEQMNFLTLWFVLLYLRPSIKNSNDLKRHIEDKIIKFYSEEISSNQFFSYLYYTGCVKVLPEGSSFKPIEEIFTKRYSGLFSKGFTKGEFENKINIKIEEAQKLIMQCLNDDTKFQFNSIDEDLLRILIKSNNLENKENEIINLLKETTKSISEVKIELIKLCPKIENLLQMWKNKSEVKSLELSPVGLVIAILNYNRVTGENINITNFI